MFHFRRPHRSRLKTPEGRFGRFSVTGKRSIPLKLKQLFHAKTGILVLITILIFGLLYAVFVSPLFKIQDVDIMTTYQDIPKEKLKAALFAKLHLKHLLFSEIKTPVREVQKKFPEVSGISCDRNFKRRTLECEATSFPLMAVIKHEGKKYYINENGVVIAYDGRKLGLPTFDLVLNPVFQSAASVIPSEVPHASLRDAAEGSRNPIFSVVVGKKILETDEIQKILKTLQEFEKILKWKVLEAQYVQVAGELSLTSRQTTGKSQIPMLAPSVVEGTNNQKVPDPESSDHDLTILFDLRRNLDEQLEKLLKTKEVIDMSKVTRIDLSIDGEKVFYR